MTALVSTVEAVTQSAMRGTWRPFASNEMGPRAKRGVVAHLEGCAECRKIVARHREIARRFRDLERKAIAHVASQTES